MHARGAKFRAGREVTDLAPASFEKLALVSMALRSWGGEHHRPEEVKVEERMMTLLVAKPGPLRDALQSLISTMPDLVMPLTADTGLLALRMIRESQPLLVVVGGGLPDEEVLELLRQIKDEWPETACLVLSESVQQRRLALAAGADSVLPAGLPAGRIFSAIRETLGTA